MSVITCHNASWSKSHFGVQHLGFTKSAHATVEDYGSFVEWGCYSWVTNQWFAQGSCRSLTLAKKKAREALLNFHKINGETIRNR